jgi:WD40 repeat protein
MEEFTNSCRLKYKESFGEPIVGLDWNLYSDRILIVRGTDTSVILEVKTPEGITEVKGTLNTDGRLQDTSLCDSTNSALLVFEKRAVVINLQDFSVYRELEREDGFLEGGFADEDTVYITIPAMSGCVDWSFWNIKDNSFQEYELERYDHYGRGAVIHPGKKLIGACWNAYESGFLIHSVTPYKNRLRYFDFGDDECSRSEYEAFAPSFNTIGNKIAFVVNPYSGYQNNIEKLCVYDIENQKTPLHEIELTDYEKESVKETFFIGQDEFIILSKTRSVDIVDLRLLKTERIIDNEIDCIAVNSATGQFVTSTGKDLNIYSIEDKKKSEADYNNRSSIEFADSFIARHSEKLKIAGDEEIQFYTGISDTDEIPKLYVKFGYERAIYRLDTKDVIEERLSASTKTEVDNWFRLNQENKLSQWRENNGIKKMTVLKSEDGCPIEIFSGQRAMELYPNVRVYYKNSDWMINVDDPKERELLPEEIKGKVNRWIDENYQKITEPWSDSSEKELETSVIQSQNREKRSGFWLFLKKWL